MSVVIKTIADGEEVYFMIHFQKIDNLKVCIKASNLKYDGSTLTFNGTGIFVTEKYSCPTEIKVKSCDETATIMFIH